MSSVERERVQKEPKFTRGEKCIFTHVVSTFMLIIILVIIYFVHVCLVSHKGDDIFKTTRRQGVLTAESALVDYKGLGLVFLTGEPMQALCNALLIQTKWSIAPGLCVAGRSEPHLSDMLPFWTIKYRVDSGRYVSKIIRSFTHPHFNKDDLDNNIGLLEHEEFSSVPLFTFPTRPGDVLEDKQIANNIGFISWDLASDPKVMHNDVIVRTPIKGPMPYDECRTYVTSITELRGHEFCVVVGRQYDIDLVYGALLLYANSVIGFFSWGQRQPGDFPIVILNITHYKDWLDYVTT